MLKEVSKKSSTVVILIAIIIAILTTFFILNSVQTLRTVKTEAEESTSSGEISLVIKNPPADRSKAYGVVNLEIKGGG